MRQVLARSMASLGIAFDQIKQALNQWAEPIREVVEHLYIVSGTSERDAILSGLEAGIITKRTAQRLLKRGGWE